MFSVGGDPVALGLAVSSRPGRTSPALLHELLPNSARFGVLSDPAYPTTQAFNRDLQAAACTLGLQLVVVNAGTDSDLETAFATFSQQRLAAVLVGSSAFYTRHAEQLAALAARHVLPAM
jgi:putative ABC transport system substrate-binding protein